MGTASNTITMISSQSRPGNSIHANAYAAKAPTATTTIVAGTGIMVVFSRDPAAAGLGSRLASFSTVRSAGVGRTAHQPGAALAPTVRNDINSSPTVGHP